jgi:hypothetical protein
MRRLPLVCLLLSACAAEPPPDVEAGAAPLSPASRWLGCPTPAVAQGSLCVLEGDVTGGITLPSGTHLNCKGHRVIPSVPDGQPVPPETRTAAFLVNGARDVKIQSCVVARNDRGTPADPADDVLFDLGVLVANVHAPSGAPRGQVVNRIAGNHIEARTGILLLDADQQEIVDNVIDFVTSNGVRMIGDSDDNVIRGNTFTGRNMDVETGTGTGGVYIGNAAFLETYLVAGQVVQSPLDLDADRVDDQDWGPERNVIAHNSIELLDVSRTLDSPNGRVGIGVTNKARDTEVRGNTIRGGAVGIMTIGANFAQATIPGRCSEDPSRLCSTGSAHVCRLDPSVSCTSGADCPMNCRPATDMNCVGTTVSCASNADCAGVPGSTGVCTTTCFGNASLPCTLGTQCYNRCDVNECWIEGHDATSKGDCTSPPPVVITANDLRLDGRVFNTRIVENYLPGPFLGRNPGPTQKGTAIQIAPTVGAYVAGNVIDGDLINQGIAIARAAIGNAVITRNVVRIGPPRSSADAASNAVLFFGEALDELGYGAKISLNDLSGTRRIAAPAYPSSNPRFRAELSVGACSGDASVACITDGDCEVGRCSDDGAACVKDTDCYRGLARTLGGRQTCVDRVDRGTCSGARGNHWGHPCDVGDGFPASATPNPAVFADSRPYGVAVATLSDSELPTTREGGSCAGP